MEEDFSSEILGEIVGIKFGLCTHPEICKASISESPINHVSQLSNSFLGLSLEFGKCESCGTTEPDKCEASVLERYAAFFQSRVGMKKTIDLAVSGHVRDLEELANSESKNVMVKKDDSLDNITLFSMITLMMSLVLMAPVTFFSEGFKFTPYIQSAGVNVQQIYTKSLLAALCFHAYQQVSFMILARVSPVTHSFGNCVKRVVVILSSIIFFKTPVSSVNDFGTGIALAGVFLYSRVKRIKPMSKTA